MKTNALRLILWAVLPLFLASCGSITPRADYKELARASIRLGVDIDRKDNHKLYVQAARWIGTPYRSGGSSLRGTDCSGLARQLYGQVYRKQLPRTTSGQLKACRRVTRRKLREGDLVFFGSPRSRRKVAHVGIYLKEGKFIHASTSSGVIVSSLDEEYYRRYWLRGGRLR